MNQIKMQTRPRVVELVLDLQPIGREWDEGYEPIIASDVGEPFDYPRQFSQPPGHKPITGQPDA
jgi:hypothetical protein